MEDTFEIPVTYKGQELHFAAQLQQLGYVHRFAVDVNGQEILFEPDEERNYRALMDSEQTGAHKPVNIELLQAIAEAIAAILK